MILTGISLQHFRSYSSSTYHFSPTTTIVVGPNTAGKSNLLEAINLLSSGKSFRAEKDLQMISSGQHLARVKGQIEDGGGKDVLEVIITDSVGMSRSFTKRFLVNGVPKRRVDFAGRLPALLFVPSDLDIIISSPSHRRSFLDDVLDLVDRQYRFSSTAYDKALRHRNALLDVVAETGIRNDEQFKYWDDILVKNGSYITEKREELIEFFNTEKKSLFDLFVTYDHSKISYERLEQYKGAEIGAKVTLVGPHRDDFFVEFPDKGEKFNVKQFGSRGQQRLVVLQLKLLQLSYIEKIMGQRPLLLLDDIFSELDDRHIKDVLDIVGMQQTIVTTTHQEFIKSKIKEALVIELKKD